VVRIWESVFLIGFFVLALVLVVLLYRPAPGPRGAFIDIDTQLQGESGKVKVAKLKINLNEQRHLDNFPRQIGDWQALDNEKGESLKRILVADVLLLRTYSKEKFGQPIFLLITHSQRGSSFHPPPVCYKAYGYSIGEESEATISTEDRALRKRIDEQSPDTTDQQSPETPGEWLATKLNIPIYPAEIPVNKLVVYKTDKDETVERRLVFYLYLRDLEFISHEFSMLRVSALIPVNGHYDDIEKEMKDFMSEVLALTLEDYGGEKETVIGIIASLGPKGYFAIAALFAVPLAMIIYPLVVRKVFTSGNYKEVAEQESENVGKTPDRPEGDTDKTDETKTIDQSLSLPFNLAEKTGNDRILGAYYNSEWIIEKATNVAAASCPTLRDFLNKVIPRLPAETADQFAELTKITEVVMYSVSEQDERSITRSCQLADEIIEVLLTCPQIVYHLGC
jgi:hypothetical protein